MKKASVVIFCGSTPQIYFHLFPRKNGTGLESPGGKLEFKEDYIGAAIRETHEEVDIRLEKKDLIFFKNYNHRARNYFLAIYLCLDKNFNLKKIFYEDLPFEHLAFEEDILGLYLEIKNFLLECRNIL